VKLPVIYIHDGSASYLPEAPSSASFSVNVSMCQRSYATVAYEPRVGRCETCAVFRLNESALGLKPRGFCGRTGLEKNADGSGFCDEHEPKP
jgi:hypothetical protein